MGILYRIRAKSLLEKKIKLTEENRKKKFTHSFTGFQVTHKTEHCSIACQETSTSDNFIHQSLLNGLTKHNESDRL